MAYRSDDIIIEKSVGMKRDQTTPTNNCRTFGFSNKLKEPVNRKRKVAYRATNATTLVNCKLSTIILLYKQEPWNMIK
jgi:hypothetical protein